MRKPSLYSSSNSWVISKISKLNPKMSAQNLRWEVLTKISEILDAQFLFVNLLSEFIRVLF